MRSGCTSCPAQVDLFSHHRNQSRVNIFPVGLDAADENVSEAALLLVTVADTWQSVAAALGGASAPHSSCVLLQSDLYRKRRRTKPEAQATNC